MAFEASIRRRTTQPPVYVADEKALHDYARVYDNAKSRQRASSPARTIADHGDTLVLLALTLVSFLTRFYRIGWSNKVVYVCYTFYFILSSILFSLISVNSWDEAHFGKFGSYYIKREFYFDVHPPLGKILIGLAGVLARYDGTFEFKSGDSYPDNVNYTAMRMFCALWGALMVPVAFLTAKELRMTRWGSFAAGLMVLFDNAYIVISRFILLDSLLLFFTTLSFYCLTKFHNQQSRPFSINWWLWLFNTGSALGLVSSIKWIGFFVVALVGVYTLENLWDLLGDLQISETAYLKHWMSRILCLIIVPIIIYATSFKLHFFILERSGPGDAQMSSLFQANLRGTLLKDGPLELAYGARFTLKNFGYGGGLLHSHVQTFPYGSKQQQVTCYHHKDSNNDWIIKKTREDELSDQRKEREEQLNAARQGIDLIASKLNATQVEYVRHGDIVRLIHASTTRNLHSHAVAAPITKKMNEVSCYGNETMGDVNDYWIVEIFDDLIYGKSTTNSIKKLSTRIHLRHKTSGCLLRSHNVNLPQWGFKQAEVACDKRRDNILDVFNMWNVESHWNDRLSQANPELMRSKFLQDFMHLNVAMLTSNNALVPDPEKEPDALTSSPIEWPLLLTGVRMCSWGDNDIKFYMFGNPIIWWIGAASIVLYTLCLGIYLIGFQRKYTTWTQNQWNHFKVVGKMLLFGWTFHYLPFSIMGRVTYLHHYFPALYFAILMSAYMIDHLTRNYLHRLLRHVVWLTFTIAVVAMFAYFSPLTFGLNAPSAEFAKNKKWVKTWKCTYQFYFLKC